MKDYKSISKAETFFDAYNNAQKAKNKYADYIKKVEEGEFYAVPNSVEEEYEEAMIEFGMLLP